jgi:hypothetical protein
MTKKEEIMILTSDIKALETYMKDGKPYINNYTGVINDLSSKREQLKTLQNEIQKEIRET